MGDGPDFGSWEEAARYWGSMHDHEFAYREVYQQALIEVRDFVKKWPNAVHFRRIFTICDVALNFSDVKDVNPGQPDANAGFAGPEE